MTRVKLLVLAAMALLAFAAVGTAVAQAEETALLLLAGEVTELEGTFKGGAGTLATLSGKTLTGTSVEGTVKGCEKLGASITDTNLCKDILLVFKGVKQGAVNCRSEMGNGEEKDPIETVLVLVDLHLASEETSAKVLQPLLLFKVLGVLLGEPGEELTINCGGVKNKVKGTIGCLLLPGLTNIAVGTEAEILCKLTGNDPNTGTCTVLCDWLKEFPFLSNLGAGFEDAWMAIHAKGSFNKDVFIDD